MDNNSLYSVNVPKKEYLDVINDIFRMVTIQVTIQFLFYLNSPNEVDFFSADFILMLIYLVMGVYIG